MASVFIDIPNIGPVEARNAATESTLRELVNAIKGMQSANRAAGRAGGAGGGIGGSQASDALDDVGNAAGNVAQGLGSVVGKVFKFGGAVAGTIEALAGFSNALAQQLSSFSNLDDSLTAAAGEIPLLGQTFAAVAGAAEKNVAAFQAATSSGATFGGSVQAMNRAASAAGMTLNDFANVIAQNGEALRLLGTNTADGADRFAQLSKSLRAGGAMSELANLGLTTQEINEGMAGYIEILGRTGKLENMSNAQLVQGSAKYLKEMDLLAKVTGKNREEIENTRKERLADAQFQAMANGLTAEAQERLNSTLDSMPAGLQGVAKDIIATGTATTEESQQFMAMMPQSAAMMREFSQITRNGGTITAEMQNELRNTMAMEGDARKTQYADIARFGGEVSTVYNGMVEASNMQIDAVKNAADAQNEATNSNDALASSTEAMKRRIAELSNLFTRLLSDTGMLDTFMIAFESVASFTKKVVYPIFLTLGKIFKPIIKIVTGILEPAFTIIGNLFLAIQPALDSFLNAIDGAVDFVLAPFKFLANATSGIANAFISLQYKFGDIALFIKDKFEDTFHYLKFALNPFADRAEYEEELKKRQEAREQRDTARHAERDKYLAKNNEIMKEEANLREESAKAQAGLDYSSPEALAKSFAGQQGSYLAGDDTKESAVTAGADIKQSMADAINSSISTAGIQIPESVVAGVESTVIEPVKKAGAIIADGISTAVDGVSGFFSGMFKSDESPAQASITQLENKIQAMVSSREALEERGPVKNTARGRRHHTAQLELRDKRIAALQAELTEKRSELPDGQASLEKQKEELGEVTEAERTAAAETMSERGYGESDELNTTMIAILNEMRQQRRIAQQQLTVQEGMSGDIYIGA